MNLLIKILDQLQQVHLESIRQYEFGKFLEKRIPLIKESIKKRVIKEVNEWLTGYAIKICIVFNYIIIIIFHILDSIYCKNTFNCYYNGLICFINENIVINFILFRWI